MFLCEFRTGVADADTGKYRPSHPRRGRPTRTGANDGGGCDFAPARPHHTNRSALDRREQRQGRRQGQALRARSSSPRHVADRGHASSRNGRARHRRGNGEARQSAGDRVGEARLQVRGSDE